MGLGGAPNLIKKHNALQFGKTCRFHGNIHARNTFQIVVMANDETAVRGSVDIGFNAVIGAVACRNEGRGGIFRLNTRKSSVSNDERILLFKFDCVHNMSPLI